MELRQIVLTFPAVHPTAPRSYRIRHGLGSRVVHSTRCIVRVGISVTELRNSPLHTCSSSGDYTDAQRRGTVLQVES